MTQTWAGPRCWGRRGRGRCTPAGGPPCPPRGTPGRSRRPGGSWGTPPRCQAPGGPSTGRRSYSCNCGTWKYLPSQALLYYTTCDWRGWHERRVLIWGRCLPAWTGSWWRGGWGWRCRCPASLASVMKGEVSACRWVNKWKPSVVRFN